MASDFGTALGSLRTRFKAAFWPLFVPMLRAPPFKISGLMHWIWGSCSQKLKALYTCRTAQSPHPALPPWPFWEKGVGAWGKAWCCAAARSCAPIASCTHIVGLQLSTRPFLVLWGSWWDVTHREGKILTGLSLGNQIQVVGACGTAACHPQGGSGVRTGWPKEQGDLGRAYSVAVCFYIYI